MTKHIPLILIYMTTHFYCLVFVFIMYLYNFIDKILIFIHVLFTIDEFLV